MSPRPSVQDARSSQRERILEVFEERARPSGPRAVVMAELARDLGISTRTLYQHFASKAELVEEILSRWAAAVADEQERRLRGGRPVEARVVEAASVWIDAQDRFSDAFWQQLASDFPEASRVLSDEIRRSLVRARKLVAHEIGPGYHIDLALSLLKAGIRAALDPRRCDALGISRQEAVRQAVRLWCRGALRPGEGVAAVD